MSSFAFLLLCIQACLVQNALASCYGSGPINAYAPASGLGSSCGYKAGPYVDSCGYSSLAGYGSGLAGYGSGLAGYGAGINGYGAGLTGYGAGCGCSTPYGGSGIGNVAVAGELPVGGATAVAGQVPIIGAVEYAGPVAAAGTVTIAGSCACGCNAGPYAYGIY